EMDPTMFKTLVELQVPYICMHMQGIPQNMQEIPSYENITRSLIRYFSEKAAKLHTMGLNDLIIDVGFGFGKTVEHNYTLLNKLDLFKALDLPMLVGISRKSMLFTPLNSTPGEALNATTAANTIALLKGANILRVHDVKQAVEACKIVALTHQKSDE
ncbi:MAG: dihydropteroate synthase, partial [Lutibacter sp.]|nr:dihydropteroate synthase [Lutibacter sp.]